METPPVFLRAADWAHARDFGCPAGIALRRVLLDLTGPPRVGACTLDSPVPLPDWPVRERRVVWPATAPGVDVVLLLHPGPVGAAVRSRIAAGPQLILVVPELPAEFPVEPGELLDARARLLSCEIRALAARHPQVAAELHVLAGPAVTPDRVPRVAVISPRPVAVDLPGCVIAGDADVDAVIAVAPPGGWTAADHATLADAARRAGRLISTAPLPADIPGTVAAPDRLPEALRHALALPVAAPAPRPGAWARAVDRMERRRLLLLDALTSRPDIAGLRDMVRAHGLQPAPGPRWHEGLGESLLLGVVSGAALGRAVSSVGAGVVAGVTVAAMRWRRGRRQAWERWVREESGRLRRAPGTGPAVWLRRQLAKENS